MTAHQLTEEQRGNTVVLNLDPECHQEMGSANTNVKEPGFAKSSLRLRGLQKRKGGWKALSEGSLSFHSISSPSLHSWLPCFLGSKLQ